MKKSVTFKNSQYFPRNQNIMAINISAEKPLKIVPFPPNS